MERLLAKARQYDTVTILTCIIKLSADPLDETTRMARAALIEVYNERLGDDATEALLDALEL